MGSERAEQSNAIWYTLIESCRRRRLDPWNYLVWLFEELSKTKIIADTFASHPPEPTPRNLKTNPAPLRKQRNHKRRS